MALETLTNALDRLAERGFGDDLIAAGSRLRSVTTGTEHDPATLGITETIRFEGDTDPGDEAVLLAISTHGGEPLGTFVTPYGPSASADQAEILRHLHQVVFTAEESHDHGVHDHGVHDHGVHDHVAAVFADRETAEAAIDELREIGLGSDRMGVAIHSSDHTVFENDEEADLLRDAEVGAGVGAALGFAAGMLLFAIAVPGVGLLGAGGTLALGAAGGFGGSMLGTILGVAVGSEEFDEHRTLAEPRLQPGEVLVVACAHDHGSSVEAVLQRHGGRLLPADV